jgi:hypothetical protein
MGPEKGADIFGVRARDVVVRNGTIQGEMSFVFDHESAISVIDSTTMTNTATRTRARCARGSQCTITGGSATMYLFLCFMMGDPDNNSTSSITLDNVNINIEMAGIQCKSVTIKNSRLVGGTVDATESLTFTNNVVTSNGIRPQQDLRPSGSFDISDNVFSDMIITQLWGGTGVVARNTFERNALAGFTIFQGGDVVVSDNKFFQNGHGSTPWPDEERGGLITHGTATGRSVTVRKNTASGNAGYGMWVATGNILDGGGNKSSGDEFGCFGVVCASG